MVRPVARMAVVAAVFAATAACAASGQPFPAASAVSPSASAVSPSASSAPSYPPHQKANVAAFDMGKIRKGPANPVPGTAYPYDLYTHCGGELVRFGGSKWRMAHSLDWPLGLGYIAGTMELIDAGTARFVIDQRHFETPSEVIIYRKTAEEIPRCM